MDNIVQEAQDIATKVLNPEQPQAGNIANRTGRKLFDPTDADKTKAPTYIPGESALTSRGYSFARAALAICTGDFSQAKVELEISRKLQDLGFTPVNGNALLVPLDADFLERHDRTREAFGGWFKRFMTQEYRPNPAIARKLVEVLKIRTLQEGVGSAGGFLVDSVSAPDLIELIRDNAVVEKAGARVITFPKGGQLVFKRQAGGATAYWVTEGSAITSSQPSFGQLTLQEKYLGIVVKASNQLIQHATPDIETIIREDMAAVAALAMDLAFLRGSGSSGVPQGILNTSGVKVYWITSTGDSSGDGRPIKPEDIITMRGMVLKAKKHQQGNVAFIFNTDMETELLKLRADAVSANDRAGMFLFGGGLNEGVPSKLAGFPWFVSDQIPSNLTVGSATNCTEIYAGDFSEAIIARGAVGEILPNQSAETAYLQNETWFRLVLGVDFGLRHPEVFVVGKGATVMSL